MYLLVGLGNPGRQYAGNRHNVGFMVLDELARRVGASPARQRMGAELQEATVAGNKALLCKPMEFMNVSGQAVARAATFYKVAPERIVVAHDDMDLDLGRVRLGQGGGAGGHNGLRSLIASLGSKDFLRIRLGVGRPPAAWDPADYVLSDFSTGERRTLANLIEEAASAVELLLDKGLPAAMNKFNQRKKTENGKVD
jgi:PTH1 family peptidyl-tRNA hydrolase